MKFLKLIYIFIISAILTGCGNTSTAKDDSFNIVTSFYPIYVMTENIGENAENITVRNLTKPTEGCLHDYQLTTGDLKTLDNADCLIINGLGMESFIDNALKQYPDIIIIDSSKIYQNSEYLITTAEEEHGHSHEVNPHIWLNTLNAKAQVDNIAKALSALNPENTEIYQNNSRNYISEINKLEEYIPQIHEEISTISFHEGFEYLLEEFGYHIEMCYSLEENTQPSPKKLAEITDLIKNNNIKTIFAADDNTLSVAETISHETGAKLVILDPITIKVNGKNDYTEKMTQNMKALQSQEATNE